MVTANEAKAIAELKERIAQRFSLYNMILFGSKARGDDDVWSDIDLLVLLDQEADWLVEKEIIHIAHDIEIASDVVFGLIIVSKNEWMDSGHYSLRQIVEREGQAA